MATQRIAIVTGGNRGIGLEVCKELAQRGCIVVLTSRNEAKGQAAVAKLTDTHIVYHPLDVTSQESVNALRDFTARQFGDVDVLVNNAAIYIDGSRNVLNVGMDSVRETFETNVYGPWMMCQAFVPMMVKKNYGRVVNVSSQAGQLSSMGSSTPSYNASKAALNAITVMVASIVRGKNVLVNSVCPGWVKTDMGGPGAPRSVEQGADTIVWLATLPDGGPTGGFFHDRKRIEW